MPETDENPRGELALRTFAMPADVNINGDIFGGWVVSQMDMAGGIVAAGRARGRVVTVSIEAMHFIRPVNVGDIVCVYAEVERVGRTSMGIHIEAWTLQRHLSHRRKVTEATFTFVAVDEDGKPRVVPPEAPSTDES